MSPVTPAAFDRFPSPHSGCGIIDKFRSNSKPWTRSPNHVLTKDKGKHWKMLVLAKPMNQKFYIVQTMHTNWKIRAGETTQSAKCSLCKQEELNSVSWTHIQKRGIVDSAGEGDTVDTWPKSQPTLIKGFRVRERPSLQTRWTAPGEWHPLLTSGLHMHVCICTHSKHTHKLVNKKIYLALQASHLHTINATNTTHSIYSHVTYNHLKV